MSASLIKKEKIISAGQVLFFIAVFVFGSFLSNSIAKHFFIPDDNANIWFLLAGMLFAGMLMLPRNLALLLALGIPLFALLNNGVPDQNHFAEFISVNLSFLTSYGLVILFLRKIAKFDPRNPNRRDALILVIAMFIAPAGDALLQNLFKFSAYEQFDKIAFWNRVYVSSISDYVGVFCVVLPVLVMFDIKNITRDIKHAQYDKKTLSKIAQSVFFALISFFMFFSKTEGNEYPWSGSEIYFSVLPIAWFSLVYGWRGASIASTIFAFVTMGCLFDHGSFYDLIGFEMFVSFACMSFFVMGVIEDERKLVRYDLEKIVDDRTKKLSQEVKHKQIALERLAEAERIAHLGHWEWDALENYFECSEEMCRIYDFPKNAKIQDSSMLLSKVDPRDLEMVSGVVKEVLAGKPVFDIQHRIKTADNEIRFVRLHGEATFDKDGKALRLIGAAIDITSFKENELALRESDAQMRAVLNAGLEKIALLDAKGNIVTCNKAAARVFGYSSPDSVSGKPFFDTYCAEDVSGTLLDWFNIVLSTGESVRLEYLNDGRWHDAKFYPVISDDDDVVGVALYARDVTERKEAAETLKETADRLAMAERITRLGHWEWRIRENNMFWSSEMYRIYGFSNEKEDVSLDDIFENAHPDDKEILKNAIQAIFSTGEKQELDFRIVRKDGSIAYVRSYTQMFRADDGKPKHIFGTMVDITDIRQIENALRETEAANRTILNVSDAAIMLVDRKGDILSVNRQAARNFRLRPKYMLGHSLFEILPEEHAAVFYDWITRTVRRKRQESFIHERRGRWEEHTLSPVRESNGSVLRVAIFSRDITRKKQAEEALAMAKETAEEANREKSRFLASASHDLRQPLQALNMFIDALSAENLENNHRIILDKISASSEALGNLLNNLLDISRLEAGGIEPKFENFLLGPLMRQLEVEYSPSAKQKKLDLRVVPFDRYVHSDPGLIERILRNLISNAIRYTKEGKVLVGCRTSGKNIVVEVWDTGIGIEESQLNMIFNEFHQVGNKARKRREGVGLGLAIVERMCNLVNTSVDVKSKLGKGSVFKFSLPIAQDVKVPKIEINNDKYDLPNGTFVLAIDDDPDILSAVVMCLEADGCEVIPCSSRDETLETLEVVNKKPDIILADYRLGEDENGIDLLHEIRSIKGDDIPGIILTADSEKDILRRAEESGFPLLRKPLSAIFLKKAISDFLN